MKIVQTHWLWDDIEINGCTYGVNGINLGSVEDLKQQDLEPIEIDWRKP